MIPGRPNRHSDPRGTRGSVLVPVVAAMLILLLAGTAIVELIGSQRMQSALSAESARAFWIAEAGLWHAAHEDTAISTPVSFAGGGYTVTKSGNEYTATASLNNATRVVTFTFNASGGPGGGGGPLDVVASAATASKAGSRWIELNLVSISSTDVVIESFSLSADVSTERVRWLTLANRLIWLRFFGVDLPTGVLALNWGSTSDRTIAAGASPELRIVFRADPSGTVTYTLTLAFTNGASSTIVFTINW